MPSGLIFILIYLKLGEKARWILAGEFMRKGDIIRTYSEIPQNPIRARDGDTHPVGALMPGTRVHNVEPIPGEGGRFCVNAGTSAEILRREGNRTIIKLPNKREISVENTCTAVVGRCSNVYHYTVDLMCWERARWMGMHFASGKWHRKDGYCGRKPHPPKPLIVFGEDSEKKERLEYCYLSKN